MPASLIPDYLFVLVFVLLSRFNMVLSVIGGFFSWGLGAHLLLKNPPETFSESFWIYFLPLILLIYFFIRILEKDHHLKPVPITWQRTLLRSLIGGSIIFLIVFLSHTLGNIWGGLFSAFPASFTATLLIFYHVHGKKVIPAVGESLFFPGALGYPIYAAVAAWSFPLWGIWIGTLFAYIATFMFYLLYHQTLRIVPRGNSLT